MLHEAMMLIEEVVEVLYFHKQSIVYSGFIGGDSCNCLQLCQGFPNPSPGTDGEPQCDPHLARKQAL